jgi:hypothetical protein
LGQRSYAVDLSQPFTLHDNVTLNKGASALDENITSWLFLHPLSEFGEGVGGEVHSAHPEQLLNLTLSILLTAEQKFYIIGKRTFPIALSAILQRWESDARR